jgi:hypothetical protein
LASISAYEGATAAVSGAQKPPVVTTRGKDATALEQAFGGRNAVARGGGGFARDIFRRGRKPGTIP